MTRLAWYSSDTKLQRLFAGALGSEYDLAPLDTEQDVRTLLAGDRADVVILDFDSRYDGPDRFRTVLERAVASGIPVVVMADDRDRDIAVHLPGSGAYEFLRRPPSMAELRAVLRRAHEYGRVKHELAARASLQQSVGCDNLVGLSGPAQRLYGLIRRVTSLNAFVLVHGESGTGKELVAKAIHNLSDRASKPFVAVPCGAIPETLMESELFGHEKGAFTGTAGARAGYIEQAEGGTLFLDEIGELSLALQVKLLRVLQQKEFSRLGSGRLIPLRARVLFATHRNLAEMVRQQTFRQDLYFRVNVMQIQVPPLRDRSEDVPLLAKHFLARYAQEFGRDALDISPDAMSLLTEYDWPGNVRELENAVQSALILCEGGTIEPVHLPPAIQALMPQAGPVLAAGGSNFEQQVRNFKLRLVLKSIEDCNGNRSLAARRLQISRSYLHRLLQEDVVEEHSAERCAG